MWVWVGGLKKNCNFWSCKRRIWILSVFLLTNDVNCYMLFSSVIAIKVSCPSLVELTHNFSIRKRWRARQQQWCENAKQLPLQKHPNSDNSTLAIIHTVIQIFSVTGPGIESSNFLLNWSICHIIVIIYFLDQSRVVNVSINVSCDNGGGTI
mgnify:CR=1 FL=1